MYVHITSEWLGTAGPPCWFGREFPLLRLRCYPDLLPVTPHVPMIARTSGRIPLFLARSRSRGIRGLFVMAEKKQKATPDKAAKHKYPLEVSSSCFGSSQEFELCKQLYQE